MGLARDAVLIVVAVDRDLARPWGHRQLVEIYEQAVVPRSEILVPDIASAYDGGLVAGREALVADAAVEQERVRRKPSTFG